MTDDHTDGAVADARAGAGTGAPAGGVSRRRARRGRVASLANRLQPYVRHRFDGATDGWWSPPRTTPTPWHRSHATRTRAEQLAQVLERLAVLVEAGDQLGAAVGRVAAAGRGEVATELAAVGAQLRSDRPLDEAFHDWAHRAGCPAVGVLAADVQRCSSSGDLVATLRHHAGRRRLVAHRQHRELLRRRVRVTWLAALASVAAATVPVVA